MFIRLFITCIGLLSTITIIHAQQASANYEVEIRNDNDMYLFILQDQYYTNGLFLNLRKSFESSRLGPREKNRLMELEVGHEMYNSYTAQIDSIQAVDRPIAGYLYASARMHHHYQRENYLSYSLAIGTIGKRAAGKELQAGLHNLLNMYHAAGWEYQLNNAWSIDAGIIHNKLIGRTSNHILDMSIQSSAKLGLLHARVKSGPLFRIGQLLPFDQSAHFGARLQASGDQPEKEWYLFYRPEVSAVFYDGTLQGGLLQKEKGPVTAEPKTWQISNNFGFVMAQRAVTAKIQYFFNTKESDQSIFRHQYGSVSLAYRF